MARRRGPRRWWIDLLLLFTTAVLGLVVPRLIDGYSAVQWTRYVVAQEPDPLGQRSRTAGVHAARTIDAVAPLPWAREAARLALAFGTRQEATNRRAAVALYEQVARALEAVGAIPGRTLGLSSLADDARAKAQAARAATDEGGRR